MVFIFQNITILTLSFIYWNDKWHVFLEEIDGTFIIPLYVYHEQHGGMCRWWTICVLLIELHDCRKAVRIFSQRSILDDSCSWYQELVSYIVTTTVLCLCNPTETGINQIWHRFLIHVYLYFFMTKLNNPPLISDYPSMPRIMNIYRDIHVSSYDIFVSCANERLCIVNRYTV